MAVTKNITLGTLSRLEPHYVCSILVYFARAGARSRTKAPELPVRYSVPIVVLFLCAGSGLVELLSG